MFVIKQLIYIPSYFYNYDPYLFIIKFLKDNGLELISIYHIFDDLSGSIILEVIKNSDPILFMEI